MREDLKKSFGKRESLFADSRTDCFRLFNTSGDGIEGLTVDIYGEYLLVQYFNRHIEELLLKNTALINDIISLSSAFPITIKGILTKNRVRGGGVPEIQEVRKSRLIEGELPGEGYTVKQNGIVAAVDLIQGQSTGIFLDMREVRDMLTPFYSDKKITNMANFFSYTSIFSVHALKNGVKHSVNVDLSKAVLKKAVDNYRLNSLHADHRDFIFGDAIKWMKVFGKAHRCFDFIIFDPPTFSRNRSRNFSVKKDYTGALKMLEDISCGGYLLTSINSYSVTRDEYISYHPPEWENLMLQNESWDFTISNKPYLKAGLWKIRG